MRSQVNFENARLIEALDYIDRDLIAEVIDEIKAPDMKQSPERDKKVTRRSIRYSLTLAACLVLISAIIPVASYVITHFDILPGRNPGSDTTTETTESIAETTESMEVPSGYDYIITEDDLEMINSAYKIRYDVQMKNFRIYKSVDEVMTRNPYVSYYFGKYGDTIVIWDYWHGGDKKCCFSIEEYNFDFYLGTVCFIVGDKWYDNTDLPEDIFTFDEAKALHDAFTEHLIPLIRKEYKVLKFISGLEIPSEKEMKEINDAYEKWNYEKLYNEYMTHSNTKDENTAYDYAYRRMGYDPHRFFNEEKYEEYHYYGKIGGKSVIATENGKSSGEVSIIEIAGYKFVLVGLETDVLIYSDGIVTELSEAFEKNLITESELAVIRERHNAYFYYFTDGRKEEPIPDELMIEEITPSLIALTLEEKREIVWEYIDSGNDLQYIYSVRCYGKFDGAYAVMIDGPFVHTQVLRSETVAGYTFNFRDGQKMYIYKEGDFYSLLEAYEREIITKENVAAIEWDKTPQ